MLWLGAVLARAQPCDGACPAVELPGFRHVVYAQNKGQAACEERVSEIRVEGHHAAAWEDVRRIGIYGLAWRGRARRWASASWCRTVTFVGGRCRRRTLLSGLPNGSGGGFVFQ